MISAWDLYIFLKDKTYDELKEMNVVVEANDIDGEFANSIEFCEGQIRISSEC